jgi:hypothetical protein
VDNARTGGAALWLVAPTRDRADHLVGLLADYGYSFLRHYGDDGRPTSSGIPPSTVAVSVPVAGPLCSRS